jgi:hypothetical protein
MKTTSGWEKKATHGIMAGHGIMARYGIMPHGTTPN